MGRITFGMVGVLWATACGGGSTPTSRDPGGKADDLGADGGLVIPGGYACDPSPVEPLGEGFFADVSEASGIQVGTYDPAPTTPIPINDHSRLGFADLNGDGCDDVVAHNLYPNWTQAQIPFTHVILENDCHGRFTDVSAASGLRDVQAGFFAFGDVDDDGDQDAFAGLDVPVDGHASAIYLNDGAGRFTEKADSGVETTTLAGNAAFGDFDRDGNLDLYVGNGHSGYLAKDQLFLGDGRGRFRDVSATALPGNPASPSNGLVVCDFDDDEDLDVFVAIYGVSNGGAQNLLWQNDGGGRFANVAVAKGFASLPGGNYFLGYGEVAEPQGSPGTYVGGNAFGLACEDVDNDGDLDVFLTTISHPDAGEYTRKWSDPSQLLINGGPDAGYAFTNEFLARGLPFNEGDVDGAIVDFDNDGRLDLSTSRTDKYETRPAYTDEAQKGWFGLFHQRADGTFASVGLASGINDPGLERGRMKGAQNHAWSDVDLDGDLDLLVGGRDQGGGRPNFLLRNDVGSRRDWLGIRLIGDGLRVNRDAIGARVRLHYAETILTRELRGSRGTYDSMDTRTLYFGLGELGCGFGIEVRWPDGTTDVFDAAETGIDTIATIAYGQGVIAR
jgi:hypothetical protein